MNPARIEALLGEPAPDEGTYANCFDPGAEAAAYRARTRDGGSARRSGVLWMRLGFAGLGLGVVIALVALTYGSRPIGPGDGGLAACGPTRSIVPAELRPLTSDALTPAARVVFEDELSALSSQLPASGWKIQTITSETIVLVAPANEHSEHFAYMELHRSGGEWHAVAYGGCLALAVV